MSGSRTKREKGCIVYLRSRNGTESERAASGFWRGMSELSPGAEQLETQESLGSLGTFRNQRQPRKYDLCLLFKADIAPLPLLKGGSVSTVFG
jgi:hypothetical protein